MNNFKNKFLNIVTDTTEKYNDNGAATLLFEFLRTRAQLDGVTFSEIVEEFSDNPGFGNNGEVGSVSIDHQSGVSYVSSSDSLWMTLGDLVTAAMNGGLGPNWWNPGWTTGQADDQITAEIAAEAVNDSSDRSRFQSFARDIPIVNVEYSNDKNFVYEKYERVTTKAKITPKQLSEIN